MRHPRDEEDEEGIVRNTKERVRFPSNAAQTGEEDNCKSSHCNEATLVLFYLQVGFQNTELLPFHKVVNGMRCSSNKHKSSEPPVVCDCAFEWCHQEICEQRVSSGRDDDQECGRDAYIPPGICHEKALNRLTVDPEQRNPGEEHDHKQLEHCHFFADPNPRKVFELGQAACVVERLRAVVHGYQLLLGGAKGHAQPLGEGFWASSTRRGRSSVQTWVRVRRHYRQCVCLTCWSPSSADSLRNALNCVHDPSCRCTIDDLVLT
mmetsp:Transcript_1953/g.3756  ORF Transcript_1953/g.3756 Transcript_1953/m.3756 type:complete len:263 (+) Transcript_1953:198-986(+)